MYADISINPVKQNVTGFVKYHFDLKEPLDTIRIDARKMEFSEVKINGNPVKFKATDREFLLFEGYEKGENLLEFNYEAFPTQAMYFVQKDNYQDVQRSEERRVGKECRSRWWTQHYKKKLHVITFVHA